MSVSCEFCVLSGKGLCYGPILRPEGSYRVFVCHCLRAINLKNDTAVARVGLLRQRKKYHKYNFYVANVTPESVCVWGGGEVGWKPLRFWFNECLKCICLSSPN
jgi:hypothetical protein